MSISQPSAEQVLDAEDFNAQIDSLFEHVEISIDPIAVCNDHTDTKTDWVDCDKGFLHLVISGEGGISIKRGTDIDLIAGQMALIQGYQLDSSNQSHKSCSLTADCTTPDWSFDSRAKLSNQIASGEFVVLRACIDISFHGVIDVLGFLEKTNILDLNAHPATQMVLPTLVHKMITGGIGTNATIRSFLNVAVTELLLAQFKRANEQTNFMPLMDEPRLMPAIKAMLNEPATHHSVGSLAEICFMSRSSFATKFSENYGIGPMEFLRDLRLNSAANLLMQQSLTIESVRQLSGFQSHSAFSRAFLSKFQCSPQAYRNNGFD